MTGAMNAAIAGLRTHMQNLNVIGNNIANVNTEGYKSARSVFKSSIYSTMSGGDDGTASIGGRNPSQIGYGSSLGTVDIDMSTGNYKVTGKSTDCMIDGEGFFLVGSKDVARNFTGTANDATALTSLNLTRVGNFDVMPDGYLCKDDGNCVYGFLCVGVWGDDAHPMTGTIPAGVKEGDPIFSDQLVPIRMPYVYRDTNAKLHIGYPRLGGGTQAAGTGVAADSQQITPAAGAQNAPETLLDYGSYLNAQGEVVLSTAHERGYFNNISINQNTGIITATCQDMDNQVVTIGCIAIGSVTNPNGVTQLGNSYYKAGAGSGKLVVTTLGGASQSMGINYINSSLANQGNNMAAGDPNAIDALRIRSNKSEILTNGLEMSKTDLAQEIANMITTQRGYQANTRIVTVTDQMLEELVNMKR